MEVNLQTVRTFNKMVKVQKKMNILNSIRDKMIMICCQGYLPQATNIKTLIKQYKKGFIMLRTIKEK